MYANDYAYSTANVPLAFVCIHELLIFSYNARCNLFYKRMLI